MNTSPQLLLHHVQLTLESLTDRPVDLLKPHSEMLADIASQFSSLHQATKADKAAVAEEVLASTSIASNHALEEAKTRRIMTSAVQRAVSLQDIIRRELKSHGSTSFRSLFGQSQGLRNQHAATISSLKSPSRQTAASVVHRVHMICACISLSFGFSEFEARAGHVPKKTQILAAVQSGEEVSVQKIGRHLNSYIEQHQSTAGVSKRVLDAAIRMGIKLDVLDHLGSDAGLPARGMSLLMGFECGAFSRLSYSALRHFRTHLDAIPGTFATFLEFNRVVSPWWEQYVDNYHMLSSPWNTAKDPVANDFSHSASSEIAISPEPIGHRVTAEGACDPMIQDHTMAPITFDFDAFFQAIEYANLAKITSAASSNIAHFPDPWTSDPYLSQAGQATF